MHQITEAPQVDEPASDNGLVSVKVMALEYLAGVVQGMDNGTLARAIRPEEQRDRLQFKGHLVADGLEVLNCDRSDHRPEPPVSISHGASARSTATEAN